MDIKPFTKQEQLKIYKKALRLYSETPSKCPIHIYLLSNPDCKTYEYGICFMIMMAIKSYYDIQYPQISTVNLLQYMPSFTDISNQYDGCGNFWFERDIYGRSKRIEILKQLIKENQPIKQTVWFMVIYNLGVSILLEEYIILDLYGRTIYNSHYTKTILPNNILIYTPFIANRPRDGLIKPQLVVHHL